MRETTKEIRKQIEQCLNEAKGAIALYELSLITMAEHVLWLIGLDLIMTAKWTQDGLVIAVDLPAGEDTALASGASECLEDILNEFVAANDKENGLVFRFASNVVLSKQEAERIRKRLKINKRKKKV